MNKEQKKFKKVVKARKISVLGRKKNDIERDAKREKVSRMKNAYVVEKKKVSLSNSEEKQRKIEGLRKVLKIPAKEIYSLEALTKKFNEAYAHEQRKSLQKAMLSGTKNDKN